MYTYIDFIFPNFDLPDTCKSGLFSLVYKWYYRFISNWKQIDLIQMTTKLSSKNETVKVSVKFIKSGTIFHETIREFNSFHEFEESSLCRDYLRMQYRSLMMAKKRNG